MAKCEAKDCAEANMQVKRRKKREKRASAKRRKDASV